MGNPDQDAGGRGTPDDGKSFHFYSLIVLLVAAAVYAGCMISPPSLMDDVDAVQAQIARNMLTSEIGKSFHFYSLIVLLVAAAVYAGCMISPPSLMDDVDAVQAQIARNMLTS